jgi:signal transduction histidine kinase
MVEFCRAFIKICFCFTCCGFLGFTVAATVTEDAELWQSLRVVPDLSGNLTPEQAWQRSQDQHSIRLTHASQVVAPANSDPHWAAWRMNSAAAAKLPLWLSLQSPTQDHSELWIRFENGPWQWQAPLHEVASLGWGSGQLFPTWPIYDTTFRHIDLLVRIEGVNRVQFPLVLQTPQQFMQQHLKLCLMIGLVLSAPVLVTLYALTFLSVLTSRTLRWFVLLVVLELVSASWVCGLMNLLWPEITRVQAAWWGQTAYGVLFGVSIYHAQSFMQTDKHHPRMHLALHLAAGVWWVVLFMCIYISPHNLRSVLLFGGSLHALILLFISLWFYCQRQSLNAAVFVSVWLVYLLGMQVYWLFRSMEWPLITTLGAHFLQGAVVATLLGWSACMQVIHQRNQLNLEMHISRERGRWFAAAHHDLWQPMQSLLLYAKAMLYAAPHRYPKLQAGMHLASQSVDDFMDYLRFWSDGIDTESLKPVINDLLTADALLRPLVEEMRLLAEQQHVMLRFRPSYCQVSVESTQVRRMVRNLLNNALRYTQAGGSVLLGCRKQSGRLWIWCMDNGSGMSTAQVNACFEAFTQFGKTEQSMRTLGLGLYSFRHLAEQMQFKVQLKSQLGKGTMIGFAVPLA